MVLIRNAPYAPFSVADCIQMQQSLLAVRRQAAWGLGYKIEHCCSIKEESTKKAGLGNMALFGDNCFEKGACSRRCAGGLDLQSCFTLEDENEKRFTQEE